MEMVIFMGAQAAGKSSFYKFRFFDSHVRINLDMLRTRNRERVLVKSCLQARQPLVVDNTNATKLIRRPYIVAAKRSGFSIRGVYFQSIANDCIARNNDRDRGSLPPVPHVAIRGTINRLELPSFEEGFDQLEFVRLSESGFAIEGWRSEV